jgi:hypothetical protein
MQFDYPYEIDLGIYFEVFVMLGLILILIISSHCVLDWFYHKQKKEK